MLNSDKRRASKAWKSFKENNILMQYTIMLVPHRSHKKPIHFNIPVGYFIMAFSSLLILLSFTTYFGWRSMKLHQVTLDNARLNKISTEQESQLSDIEFQITRLYNQVDSINETQAAVRHQVGLPEQAGIGGPRVQVQPEDLPLPGTLLGDTLFSARLTALTQNISLLSEYMSLQQQNLSALQADVTDRLAYLANIPNRVPLDNYTLTSYFAQRRSPFDETTLEAHSGIDLAADYGTPIHAAGGGVVTVSAYRASYGNVVIIDHGYGYQSLYGHCSSLAAKVGDVVARGDVIAYVGSTGRSTGSHLHLSIYYNGALINPLSMITLG